MLTVRLIECRAIMLQFFVDVETVSRNATSIQLCHAVPDKLAPIHPCIDQLLADLRESPRAKRMETQAGVDKRLAASETIKGWRWDSITIVSLRCPCMIGDQGLVKRKAKARGARLSSRPDSSRASVRAPWCYHKCPHRLQRSLTNTCIPCKAHQCVGNCSVPVGLCGDRTHLHRYGVKSSPSANSTSRNWLPMICSSSCIACISRWKRSDRKACVAPRWI